MSLLAAAGEPGIGDNEVLDQFTIPFGSWTEEAVRWVVLNLKWLLDAFAWPFETLLRNFVENFLVDLPWLVLVAIMFVIAWLFRNLTVATSTAVGLVICGLLGDQYWEETARTIGLIVVAVFLCVIIGIPMGILAGRFDSVWSVVRPTLDAMQVVHVFVYLLPFIYFWGIGAVGATMATMVFALPPLIRLTNLGIRQVPEDVVEAARAYGATELRVLRDVQLPLARPAIMTGINQTLLLAFSMLGVAAIMGAGGLGRLLFRALGQQDFALAASSGLAFFLLAVILDRITQTEAGSSGLLVRLSTAWRARRAPEVLLDDPEFNPAAPIGVPAEPEPTIVDEGTIAPIGPRERSAIIVTVVGGLIMIVSLFLTWANDAALISSYSRRSDEDLPGQSFAGYAAEGGSWFAFVAVALGIVAVAAAVRVLLGLGGGRWLGPDGAFIAAAGGLLGVLGYFVAQPSDFTLGYSHGTGVYVALIGGLVASVGAAWWLAVAPYGPRRPLKPKVLGAPLVLAVLAVTFAVISMLSMWSLDERAESVITPEIQEQIDEVKRAADAGEMDPGVAASEIQVITSGAARDRIVIDGKSDEGARLGIWVVIVAAAGAVATMVAAGVFGLSDRRRWIGGAAAMALGTGVVAISIGWIGSLARATDPNFFSGVGSFIAGQAGAILMIAGSSVIKEFERSKVYGALGPDAAIGSSSVAPASADTKRDLTSSVAT